MSDDPWERRVDDIAERLVRFTLERPAALPGCRLVCVDGRAGSGKTTLGRAMLRAAAALGSARLLHMDDMYEGWTGLGDVSARVERDLVRPLSGGRVGRYQRYDWHRAEFAEWHTVEPVDVLVLEGVGSGASAYRKHVTTLVWVDAPVDLRVRRGVARDGTAVLPKWLAWMESEDELFAREQTELRADVVVDGTGTAKHPLVFG